MQLIQSNPDYFFSLYNITNCQQFIYNVIIGFVALCESISIILIIQSINDRIMISGVIYASFWALLLLFDQMYLWRVNHYFANFMPLRMIVFRRYYVENELYRILGSSISSMRWSSLLPMEQS